MQKHNGWHAGRLRSMPPLQGLGLSVATAYNQALDAESLHRVKLTGCAAAAVPWHQLYVCTRQ